VAKPGRYFPGAIPEQYNGSALLRELYNVKHSIDRLYEGWEDMRFPASGSNLDTASSRYSYDFVNCGITFNGGATPARYANEPLCHVVQFPHGWREGSIVKPHVHWIQTTAATPNWLLRWRAYNNGDTVPAFTNAAMTSSVWTWSSGSLLNISRFPDIDMDGFNISCVLDMILYRDYANASGLFAGAESGAPNVLFKEFDLHYQIEATGSSKEFVKD
jgi:hypothetical protein